MYETSKWIDSKLRDNFFIYLNKRNEYRVKRQLKHKHQWKIDKKNKKI